MFDPAISDRSAARRGYGRRELESHPKVKVIQKHMGHSSLQTTMIYLHLTEIAEVNAREKIEQIFGRS